MCTSESSGNFLGYCQVNPCMNECPPGSLVPVAWNTLMPGQLQLLLDGAPNGASLRFDRRAIDNWHEQSRSLATEFTSQLVFEWDIVDWRRYMMS